MDATALARRLLEAVPAHRTAGIEVLRAVDGVGEVAMATAPAMSNVIGSLHSSGLIALVDAAGLAAIIAGCDREGEMDGLVPLGRRPRLTSTRRPAAGWWARAG